MVQQREPRGSADGGIGWIGLVMSPALVALSLLQWLHYESAWAAIAVVAGGLLLALAPWVHRVRIPPLHYLGGCGFLVIAGSSYARGGVILAILIFAFIPAFTCLLIHRLRAAIAWALAVAPLWAGLHALESAGMAPPRVEASLTGALIGTVTALLATSVVVFVQERRRRRETVRLIEMERALVEANKLEGIARLAGGVAHDFNNLLAIVKSHAQVISSELGKEHHLTEDAAAIEHAVNAGADLTRRLLAIGREAGPVSPHPIDLSWSASEMNKLLQKALPDDVTLRCVLARKPVVVEADPRQLEQVVMNLVLNARDAMPDGGRITMRTVSQVLPQPLPVRRGEIPAGSYGCLSVADEGEGMKEDVIDRIFEPFFTTKDRDRGTGLGLSVVHGVATTLGGHVDVVSTVGAGTTFRVWIPLTLGDVRVERPANDSEPAKPCPPATILVVDDEAAVLRATARVLRLDGHRVLVAEGGAEALEVSEAHEGKIDILLTDVSMPDMSGWDLASVLREQRPEVAVIYISGTDGLSREDAREREVFLAKPASRAALGRAISGLVR